MEYYYHRQDAEKSEVYAKSIIHAASLSDDYQEILAERTAKWILEEVEG